MHERDRETYLINPNIEFPLTVNRYIWRSYFSYFNELNIYTDENNISHPSHPMHKILIEIEPKGFMHEIFKAWQDFDEMDTCFYNKYHKEDKRGVHIAVAVMLEDALLEDSKGFWGSILGTRKPLKSISSKWKLLGYDIADNMMHSALCSYPFDAKMREPVEKEWVHRVNKYGLMSNLDDALNYVKWANVEMRDAELAAKGDLEHTPFQVFGIYSIYEGEL